MKTELAQKTKEFEQTDYGNFNGRSVLLRPFLRPINRQTELRRL